MDEPDRSSFHSAEPSEPVALRRTLDEPTGWDWSAHVRAPRPPRDPAAWTPPRSTYFGIGLLLGSVALGWLGLPFVIPGPGSVLFALLATAATYAFILVLMFRRRRLGDNRRIAEIGVGAGLPYLLIVAWFLLFS